MLLFFSGGADAGVQADAALAYRVRGSASADAATAYGVRGLVAQEAQIQYDIFNDQQVVSVIGRGFMLNMGTFMGGI